MRFSIFVRQWLLLIVALLILGGMIGGNLYVEFVSIGEVERDRLIAQTDVVDKNLELQLTATNYAIDSIRRDLPALQENANDLSLLNHRLEFMRSSMPTTRAITLFDKEGTLIARSPNGFVGQNFRTRGYFQTAFQGGDPDQLYVAPPFLAKTGEYVLNVSKILQDDGGAFSGVILASLGPEYFNTLLTSVLYAPDMQSTLVHGDGKIIYTAAEQQAISGKDAATDPDDFFAQHIKNGQATSISNGYGPFSGEQRLMVWHTIQPVTVPMDKALVIGISRDVSALFMPWRKNALVNGGLFALLAFATIIGLLFYQKRQLISARLLADQDAKRRRAEETLRESEENLSITLHSIGDAVIATDPTGRVTRMNPMAERMTGWPLPEALGRPLTEIFPIYNAITRETVTNPVHLVMEHGMVVGLANHTVLLARDGQEYQIADSAAPIRNAAGDILGVVLVFSDVTEQYKMEENLHLTRFSVEAASDAIFWITPDARIVDVNAAACRSLGYSREELLQMRVPDLDPHFNEEIWIQHFDKLRQNGSIRIESEHRTKSGKLIAVEIAANYIAYGQEERNCAFVRDITARKVAEREINSLAFYDPLTHLPNRRLLVDRLMQALASSIRNQRFGALLFIDLDNFKTLNDTLGHDIGDMLLQQVAQRITASVRERDTVARLGGDEYVVILEELASNETESTAQVETVAEKLVAALNKSYTLGLYQHHCTSSIGITLFSGPQDNLDSLMKQADLAMYQAKAAGRNALRFFNPEMQDVVSTRAALEADLRDAILNNQLFLYYQAQTIGENKLTGVEALLRWTHPQRGAISPVEFIPIAEDSGLILSIGHWVLETACAQLVAWATQPHTEHLTIAVNVSARQFRHPDFVDQVMAILDATGANPHRLKMELTESLLVEDMGDVTAKMTALKEAGVSFSLDDFGTGYSSLSYLKRLPLDQLKIDQGFVNDILSDQNDAAIAKMIIALAESMGLHVIAEGVETEMQRDFLTSHGCLAFQGFLVARPLPLDEFELFHANFCKPRAVD